MKSILIILALLSFNLTASESMNGELDEIFVGMAGLQKKVDHINYDLLRLEKSALISSEKGFKVRELKRELKEVKSLHSELLKLINDQPKVTDELKVIKKQLENINLGKIQNLIEKKSESLKTAWQIDDKLSSSETLHQAKQYSQNEDEKQTSRAFDIMTIFLTIFGAFIAWNTFKDSKFKKSIKLDSEENTKTLTEKYNEKIIQLELKNSEVIKEFKSKYDTFIDSSRFENGRIYKNLAATIYVSRFLGEKGLEDYVAKDDSGKPKIRIRGNVNNQLLVESVLIEVIDIQQCALAQFKPLIDKLPKARWLYYEALLDLAYYESDITRFGPLSDKAKKDIRNSYNEFMNNIDLWLDSEYEHFQAHNDSSWFIQRIINVAESRLFIPLCLEDTSFSSTSEIKEQIKTYSLTLFDKFKEFELEEKVIDKVFDDLDEQWNTNYDKFYINREFS